MMRAPRVEDSTGNAWPTPTHGWLTVEVMHHSSPAESWQLTHPLAFKSIIALARSRDEGLNSVHLVDVLCDDFFWTESQANDLLSVPDVAAQTPAMKARLVARVMMQMVNQDALEDVITTHLRRAGIAALGKQLHAAHTLVAHNPTGHYKYDLAMPLERRAVLKLMEINAREKVTRRRACEDNPAAWTKTGLAGNTSQNGHWDNIRNMRHMGRHAEVSEDFPLKVGEAGVCGVP